MAQIVYGFAKSGYTASRVFDVIEQEMLRKPSPLEKFTHKDLTLIMSGYELASREWSPLYLIIKEELDSYSDGILPHYDNVTII